MTSFTTPTKQQIDTAVQRMRSPEFAAYFFSRLENPWWVAPLCKEGLFKNPPPPLSVAENQISFPHWPASKYLVRMAKHVPDEVAAIFKDLETDNVSVIGDMLDASVAMPAKEGATLVPSIGRAAKARKLWFHFEDASDLCVRLANGGELNAAMNLADMLFTPALEQGRDNPNQEDAYWYREGLKNVLPVLIEKTPEAFLVKSCGWLDVLTGSQKHVIPGSGADYSWSWRPAIEEHEQNRDYDFAGVLVGFVRQAFEQALRGGHVSIEKALAILDRHTWQVFKRLRLYLINEFAEQCPDLARQCIMNREIFENIYYKHEYAMLVGRRLDLLTQQDRSLWFGWVDDGPDMTHFNDVIKERCGRDATEEERADRKKYWQFEKLHCVRKHLDSEQRVFYEGMLAKHGEPELADLNSRISTGWRHDSSMKVDDLAGLSLEKAIERIVSWVPDERHFMGPDLEGLASTFGQYIATNPEGFSKSAEALISRPAIYVRTLIHQMAEAVKAGKEIDIQCVLKLSQWVLERPLDERTTPTQGRDVLVDKNWQWTRDAISQFAQNVCQAKTGDVPRYSLDILRDPVWKIIDVMCRDRSVSYMVHDISKDDPRTRDYLDLGINSPRGKAVEAALEYARWVAICVKKTDGKHESVPGGFDAMPEVRRVLEWQIANRSVEAMALIGSCLGLIYWIDKAWLSKNAGQLFYLEGIEKSSRIVEGWAAWNAFLVWVPPHIEFYRLFKKQFAYAVSQSGQIGPAEQGRREPMNHLGEHLMLLYGRGQLGLDDDAGLLRQFLSKSHPAIRRHAFGFIGRSIENDKDVPEEAINRLIVLWETYWSGTGKKDVEDDPRAWLFGTWFSSGRFPAAWALDQLEEFVKVTPTPEPDRAIMEQLATVASVNVARAVNILDRMVRGDKEGWRVHGWLESARKILELAIRAGGGARAQAEKIINHLGRRGYAEIGDLLRITS